MRRIKNKTEDLCKENDILITLLGIKRGLEAYLKGEFVEHEIAEKRFEKYLSNVHYKF
jgi:predicted transcriptional regulator